MLKRRSIWILFALLIVAAALRVYGLPQMAGWLHHDEAYYAVDAVSLLENPRLQLYFPANTGREGLWIYILSAFMTGLGEFPIALRIASALVGVLTVVAVYALARETFKTGAIWAAAALAVLYWHVHLSHLGFRVILFPLLGALSMAALLRSHRINGGWVLTGILTGLTLYTYTAARVYVAYALVWLLWWILTDTQRRRGALTAFGVAVIVSLPLALILLTAPENNAHLQSMVIGGFDDLWTNLVNWAGAWTIAGDPIATHNIDSRPVLDTPLMLLAIAGLFAGWRVLRGRWLLLWWGGLVLAGLLPTILAMQTPHYLRGAGLIVPLVLLVGAGGAYLAKKRYLWGIVVGLLLWAGWNTTMDFTRWLAADDAPQQIYVDARVNEAMQRIGTQTPDGMPVVMPGFVYHPNADLWAAGYGREITFYDWPDDSSCYLSPRQPYVVLDLPIELNSYASRALPYVADIQTVVQHPEAFYNIYRVTPPPDLSQAWDDTPVIGDLLTAQFVAPSPQTVRVGETITLYLAFRLRQQPEEPLRWLVHLQGDPTPYEGGELWATADAPLCDLADADSGADLTFVQPLTLSLPDDLPADDYHIALGLYYPETGARLSINPPENPHGYSAAWQITISPATP